MISKLRRWVVATVMVGTTLAGTLVVASPAQAACGIWFRVYFQNGSLIGINYRYCWDPDSKTDLPVTIERWDQPAGSSHGQWVIVAKGYGNAAYQCQILTTTSTFRVNGGAGSVYACR